MNLVREYILIPAVIVLLAWDLVLADEPTPAENPSESGEILEHRELSRWVGIYRSTSEAAASYTMRLEIRSDYLDGIAFKKHFVSSLPPAEGSIGGNTVSGKVHVEGDRLYLPIPHGIDYGDKVELSAFIQVFNRAKIGGRIVLLTDKAFSQHAKGLRLNGHGVLIRCDRPNPDPDQSTSAPSVETLYSRPAVNRDTGR